MKAFILTLIIAGAKERNIDPNTAIAIAMVESNLNPAAVGSAGEYGVFQLRPEFYLPANYKTMPLEQYINIALDLMAHKQKKCGKKLLASCWNVGVSKAKKLGLQKALKGPYNRKITVQLEQLTKQCIRRASNVSR